jgi:hypothetical protein
VRPWLVPNWRRRSRKCGEWSSCCILLFISDFIWVDNGVNRTVDEIVVLFDFVERIKSLIDQIVDSCSKWCFVRFPYCDTCFRFLFYVDSYCLSDRNNQLVVWDRSNTHSPLADFIKVYLLLIQIASTFISRWNSSLLFLFYWGWLTPTVLPLLFKFCSFNLPSCPLHSSSGGLPFDSGAAVFHSFPPSFTQSKI